MTVDEQAVLGAGMGQVVSGYAPAKLAGCRRLHRRYERKASHFLACTSIACTLICYRRLAQAGDF